MRRKMRNESLEMRNRDDIKFKIMKKYFSSLIFHFSFQKGFTLVELLTSIVALVAVGSVIAGIITASLRGANKTNAIENIRQNGNYAISQVSKNIEYAQVFNGFSDDGTTYVTACPFSTVPSPTPPAPVTTQYKFVKVTLLNDSSITYSCTNAPTFTVNTKGVTTSLIDANSGSLVDCFIACIQTRSTDIPIIKIGFKLGHKDPNGLPESSTPPILFETSVTIRNYKR